MLGYAREIRKTVQKELKQIPLAKIRISAKCFIGLIIKTKMCSKLLLILLVLQLTQVDAQSSPHRSFLQWKQQHAKNYVDQTEQLYRFYIYSQNVQKINQHNSKADRTYEQGVNQFSDLTWEEFQVTYLTVLPPPKNDVDANRVSSLKQDNDFNAPTLGVNDKFDPNNPPIVGVKDKFDPNNPPIVGACTTLVDFSVVTAQNRFPAPVRFQGICGSCYSFSATSTMSGSLSLFKNVKYEFSTQEIVDCSSPYGNFGCNGGQYTATFTYAYAYAVSSESTYPYRSARSGFTGTCNTTARGKGLYKLSNFYYLTTSSLATLVSSVAKYGPFAIYVNANNAWNSYSSGTLTINDCPAVGRVNHAVMLAGYDNCGRLKIQNSWGTTWGMGGFIWLNAANNANVCNIYYAPSYLPVF